jgi:hypothetical protein
MRGNRQNRGVAGGFFLKVGRFDEVNRSRQAIDGCIDILRKPSVLGMGKKGQLKIKAAAGEDFDHPSKDSEGSGFRAMDEATKTPESICLLRIPHLNRVRRTIASNTSQL